MSEHSVGLLNLIVGMFSLGVVIGFALGMTW